MTTLGKHVIQYVGERLRRGEIQKVTARNVRNHLLNFAESWGMRPLAQLSHKAVERWLEEMTATGMAPGTKALRLSSLRNFARWCVITDVVRKDWTLLGPKVRRPRVMPRDMNNQHVALTMAEASNTRARLICWLMFGCGLRCVEVSRLNVEDLDRVTMEVHVTGKGGHERIVPVPREVVRAWDTYLDEAGHRQGALVRHADSPKRLGPERISGLVGRLVRQAGVKVRNHDGRSAHGFRAAGASDLYDVCHDPKVVQEFLGHASLEAGRPYIRRAERSQVREAQDARDLGRWRVDAA